MVGGSFYANTTWILDAPNAAVVIDTSSQTWIAGSFTNTATGQANIRETVGSNSYTFSGSTMARWLNGLGLANKTASPNGPAILVRVCDSFGSDYRASWQFFDLAMSQRYNRTISQALGLNNISNTSGGAHDWATVQGTYLSNRGIAYFAVQMTNGQVNTSGSVYADGVLFMWLSDTGTSLALQVDGVTVNTITTNGSVAPSTTINGQYYYAFPNGAGYHTVSYVNNGTGTVTADAVYWYLGNRSSGIQIWDISHTGATTSSYVNAITDFGYYMSVIQPHAVQFSLGINESAPALWRSNMETLYSTVNSNVTYAPSIVVFLQYQGRGNISTSVIQPQARLLHRHIMLH